MRPFLFLLAITSTVLIIGEARAQDASVQYNVEAITPARRELQHTPTLVIYRDATEQADALNEISKEGGAKTPAKSITPETTTPLKPVIIPGAQTIAQQSAYGIGTSGNPAYDRLVMQSAARNGIDPNLIFAVMRQESGFNPRARSYKGACGLMQLIPATARRFGVVNIFDPAENIEGGARYLRFLLDTFNGDVELTLAGYNAGEGAVINAGYKVPRYRETQNYVRSISARYGLSKYRTGRQPGAVASANPEAPEAITINGGSSSRLSNNY